MGPIGSSTMRSWNKQAPGAARPVAARVLLTPAQFFTFHGRSLLFFAVPGLHLLVHLCILGFLKAFFDNFVLACYRPCVFCNTKVKLLYVLRAF